MDNRRQSGLWDQNTQGYYQQHLPQNEGPYQYYQPPPLLTKPTAGDRAQRRSSTRRQSQPASEYATHKLAEPASKLKGSLDTATSSGLARTQHINSASRSGGRPRGNSDPFNPRSTLDDAPANLRTKPWSPAPDGAGGATVQAVPARHASNAGEHTRRGSVPDRSPLQDLEMRLDDISKEQKRARLQEAEQRARRRDSQSGGEYGDAISYQPIFNEGEALRKGSLRTNAKDSRRIASEGTYRPRGTNNEVHRSVSSRQADAGVYEPSGRDRSRHASDAPKQTGPPEQYAPSQASANPQRSQSQKTQHYAPTHRAQPSRPVQASRDGQADNVPVARSGSQRTPVTALPAPHHDPSSSGSDGVGRSNSRKYRAKHAGFAGADAAIAAGEAERNQYENALSNPATSPDHPSTSAAERGKAIYERRKAQSGWDSAQDSPISPASNHFDSEPTRSASKRAQPITPDDSPTIGREPYQRDSGTGAAVAGAVGAGAAYGGIGRSGSKSQSKSAPQSRSAKQPLQSDRIGGGGGGERGKKASGTHNDPDPVPRGSVEQYRGNKGGMPKYEIPPQTAASKEARQKVGFHDGNGDDHGRLGAWFHRDGDKADGVYRETSIPLDEWRQGGVARLTADDLEVDLHASVPPPQQAQTSKADDAPWWEKKDQRTSSASYRNSKAAAMPQLDGPYEEEAQSFRPPLFLKSEHNARGESRHSETGQLGVGREIWRGSIMIVTEDEQSDYSSVPTLRLFAQPADLVESPPRDVQQSDQELPPELKDPITGQVKLSRTGRPLYVDLSREENNRGLYSAARTPTLGPQSITGTDGQTRQHITFQDKTRIKKRDGERLGKYKDLRAVRLHTERGFTFWRWSVEIELARTQRRVAYRINRGPALGFWVPARGEVMNIMFHSCNGFSLSVNSNTFSGPDPLWRDVMNKHQSRPFHVMIGGGDQIYNDASQRDTVLFKEWLHTKNPDSKHRAPFTPDLQDELEGFFLDRYAMWFSQGLFAMANSQIPMVNIWDDHDIIDGFGSYPHHFMSSRIFTGLGAVAFKYYMLFQHQSVVAETEKEEPSWILGASPGPYIAERSRSVWMWLGGGKKVGLLGLDCRTERMRDEILSQESYDEIFDRTRAEVIKGVTKHIVVLLGVPIAYPRLNFLENILTSRAMDPIKSIGRTGMLGGFVNKFDGGVEILDDLDDHWTAKHHKAERNWFIQELQELAAEKSVRVTILGGDVHLGAVGQFFSKRSLGLPKDKDHRYMPNVISSAIVNTPPPNVMADVLNRRNKIHHLDKDTDENMIPMFPHDVDGSKRNNVHLLPRRNYCVIKEFLPGSTPPPTPPLTDSTPSVDDSARWEEDDSVRGGDRRYPPGSMKRSMSLTRGAGSLVRRLSGSRGKNKPPVSLPPEHARPYSTHSASASQASQTRRANSLSGPHPDEPRPSNQFYRRPTGLSEKAARKAAAKGGAEGNLEGREPGHIDLEGGLDISLNFELDQKNPGGETIPYRQGDINPKELKGRNAGILGRLKSIGGGKGRGKPQDYDAEGDSYSDEDDGRTITDGSRTPSPPPADGVVQGGRVGQNAQKRASYDGTAYRAPQLGVGLAPTANHQNNPYSRKDQSATGPPPIGTNAPRVASHNRATPKSPTAPGMDTYGGQRHSSAPTFTKDPGSRPYQQQQQQQQQYSQRPDTTYNRMHDQHASSAPVTPPEQYDPQRPSIDSYATGDSAEMYEQQMGPRRLSKAERFFGLGGADTEQEQQRWGKGQSGGSGDPGVDRRASQKSKPKWMVWR
ncbi:hypothetical protein K431DRAFT_339737 [Polychaeton citri CBS 116435]|uniref:PhoD-like phosphatase domain-containing protein n=1 Tax=Polychaeton citri CBS 116435 TaxID=1314669 RepID=A0A9P4Q540_9PEZI|nr:hypothetical protein K431DRAFT_339737 [Polychaeton citri CBS 116435]